MHDSPLPSARPRATRGATLLEVMVVMAIIAVMTALAAPAVLPMTRATQLQAAAAEVAAFVEIARRSAVTSGRCHRIVQTGGALRLDERNSPDCHNVTLDSPQWNTGRAWYRPEPMVTLTSGQVSFVADAMAPASPIFRPNGRLRGNADLIPSNDGTRILVEVSGINDKMRAVHITPVGRVCVVVHPQPPPALSNPVTCP